MRHAQLTSQEDLQWLAEVHLAAFRGQAFPIAGGQATTTLEPTHFALAVVVGNEDSPEQIQLYARDHIECVPWLFAPDAAGTMQLTQQGEPAKPRPRKPR